MAASLLLSILSVMVGCTKPPVYDTITEVIVHHQTAQGTAKETLSGDDLTQARDCLGGTKEINYDPDSDGGEPLQAIYLLQVKDRNGDRMFEFLTDSVLKGNKGKYYRNACILTLIR